MRLPFKGWFWPYLRLAILFQCGAHSLTCPQAPNQVASANPLVLSACGRLSQIISKELRTGSIAKATVVITLPSLSNPNTTSTTSISRPGRASNRSTGSTEPRSHGHQTSDQTISRSRRRSTATSTPITTHSTHTLAGHDGQGSKRHRKAPKGEDRTSSSSRSDYTNHIVIPVAVICTVIPVFATILVAWLLCCFRRRHLDYRIRVESENEKRVTYTHASQPILSLAAQLAPLSNRSNYISPRTETMFQFEGQVEKSFRETSVLNGGRDTDEMGAKVRPRGANTWEAFGLSQIREISPHKHNGTWLETPQASQYEKRGSSSWLSIASQD